MGGWDVSDERGEGIGRDALTGISTEDQDASMSFRVCVIRSERITSSSAGTRGLSYRSPVCTISPDPVPDRVRFSRRIRTLSVSQPINNSGLKGGEPTSVAPL